MYKKHLMKGVKKGALTTDQANDKLNAWIEAKEGKIASGVEKTKSELEQFRKMVDGKPKPKPVVVVEEEVVAAVEETVVPAAEEATEEVVAAVEEVAAPAAEEAKTEETPTEEA
jgi:small subunit ribosomal protein S16